MLFRSPCVSRLATTPARQVQWRWIAQRRHASSTPEDPSTTSEDISPTPEEISPTPENISITPEDPPWFRDLRTEMMGRDAGYLAEELTAQPLIRLSRTLASVLPREWRFPPTELRRVLLPGDHLIWFNEALPTDELLPDGTDASHSPGGPWQRRMWAGGSLQLKPEEYTHNVRGFLVNTTIASVERIKDVRLRGHDDTAKIFVTIERRFAQKDRLFETFPPANHGQRPSRANIQQHFKRQLYEDDEWGDAIYKEERNLVFFKERTAAEVDAIKAGQMAPVKYLEAPGNPEFSHTLIPTQSLLFRFSALTFNAHRIHLDRDYARNVEGHRNLLVHGPLTLTLMLKFMAGYLNNPTKAQEVIERIEYRNLASLYCDEEMRICGLTKKTTEHGHVYDIWVEGPTGGLAVKGTVYTKFPTRSQPALLPRLKKKLIRRIVTTGNSNSNMTDIRDANVGEANSPVRTLVESTGSMTSKVSSSSRSSAFTEVGCDASTMRIPINSSSTATPPVNFERSALPLASETASDRLTSAAAPSIHSLFEQQSSAHQQTSRPYRRDRRDILTRTSSYQFITSPSTASSVRLVETFKPIEPVIAPRTRRVLQRLAARVLSPLELEKQSLPYFRKYKAAPYKPIARRLALERSNFAQEGIRKNVTQIRVRYQHVGLGPRSLHPLHHPPGRKGDI